MQELIEFGSRCRHSECGFGRSHKRHSDGTPVGGYFVGITPPPEVTLPESPSEDTEPGDEVIDLRPPLITEPQVLEAGAEGDVPDEEQESLEESLDKYASYEEE